MTARRPEPAEVAGLLRAAASAIEVRGWYRGVYRDPGEVSAAAPLSLDGALHVAAYGVPQAVAGDPRAAVLGAALQAVHARIGRPWTSELWSAERWNEAPGRTVGEVLDMLREAADDAGRGAR